jgi:hypothetical protein
VQQDCCPARCHRGCHAGGTRSRHCGQRMSGCGERNSCGVDFDSCDSGTGCHHSISLRSSCCRSSCHHGWGRTHCGRHHGCGNECEFISCGGCGHGGMHLLGHIRCCR